MENAWVREVRDRCPANAVAFFFKQWGDFGRLKARWVTNGASSHVAPG